MTKKTNLSWQIKKLGEVCDFENGDRGSNYPSKSFRTVSGIPFINAGHLEDEGIDFHEMDYISRERYDLLGNGKIKRNDILFCLRGSLGKFACVGELNEGAIASSLVILRTRNSLELKYLLAYLGSQLCADMIRKYCNGAAQPNLSAGSLRKFIIPLPPLPEQKRIVTILDEAFAAIAKAKNNAEKNLQNARELFESCLQNVFTNPGDGWEVKRLRGLGVITSSKRIFKSEYVKTGVPFYRTKEIKELAHGKEISLELFISQDRYNEIKNKFGIPISGDILLSAVGTIGEMYVVQKGDEFYFKDGNIVWLKDFNSVDTYYLKYALTSFVEQIKKLSIGSAYNALTIEKLNEYSVPIATLPEQRSIVAKLDALSAEIKKLEVIYQQKLANLEELKKSILQKAFNGELVGACS